MNSRGGYISSKKAHKNTQVVLLADIYFVHDLFLLTVHIHLSGISTFTDNKLCQYFKFAASKRGDQVSKHLMAPYAGIMYIS